MKLAEQYFPSISIFPLTSMKINPFAPSFMAFVSPKPAN